LVEIFPDIKGVDFDRAWEKRVETTVDPDTGLKAFLIFARDLIAAKLAAGRPQDLADVAALRKAAESQGPHPARKKPRNRNRRTCLKPVTGVAQQDR